MTRNLPSELHIAVGVAIRTLRLARNEKLANVAHYLKMSETALSQIENGRYGGLSLATLEAICKYFGTTVDEVTRMPV